MATRTKLDPGIEWLLRSEEPLIRYRVLVDLVDTPEDDPRAVEARRGVPEGAILRALLDGQESEGGLGRHPYAKWTGEHWRLVSLMDLGAPADLSGVREAIEPVFRWLTGKAHRSNIPTIAGLPRRCASQEGNALAVAVHFRLEEDARTRLLADSLVGWQWPDGGWNCDRRAEAHHSSFHESLAPLRGLAAFARATGDRAALEASSEAVEFFLRHRVVFRERANEPISIAATEIHYPPYWRYDLLAGLRVLAETGHVTDPRAAEGLEMLAAKRRTDGRWTVDGVHFRPPGSRSGSVDVAAWSRTGEASEPATLGALLVLRAAGCRV